MVSTSPIPSLWYRTAFILGGVIYPAWSLLVPDVPWWGRSGVGALWIGAFFLVRLPKVARHQTSLMLVLAQIMAVHSLYSVAHTGYSAPFLMSLIVLLASLNAVWTSFRPFLLFNGLFLAEAAYFLYGGHSEMATATWHGLLTVSIVLFFQLDVRRRYDAEGDAARAKLDESARLSALGEMAGNIAHEINNPLTIIAGRASQIRMASDRGTLTAKQMLKAIDSIEATTERISRIIRGLLNLSRDTSHETFEHILVSEIVADAANLCSEKLRRLGVKLQVDIPEGLMASCRPTQISQVILNLMNNALDALREVPERQVTITASSGTGWITIQVSDTGGGVPLAQRDKIFQPFFTTKLPGKGTGLGLSISRQILENHGGRLTLQSQPGRTTFILILPEAPAAPIALAA